MTALLPVLLGVSLLMPLAAADANSTTEEMRATFDTECREELGYTDEQFASGFFLQSLRECVNGKLRDVRREADLKSLAGTKRKIVDRINESYKRRVAPKRMTKRTMPGSGGLSAEERGKLQKSKRHFRTIRAQKRIKMEQLEQEQDAASGAE